MSLRRKLSILLVILFVSFLMTLPRFYFGQNIGVAWDIGGIEIVGDPGIFLCSDNYYPRWHNPIADLFPQFVVDC